MKTQAERLTIVESKIDDAGRVLSPLMLGGSGDTLLVEIAVHDALNALASAMLEVGLLQMETEDTTSKGATS